MSLKFIRSPYPTLIYPIFQCLLFLMAIYYSERNAWVALSLALLASLMLAIAIHVCFHEFLHYSARNPTPFLLLPGSVTLWMGLPFDGFRVHHMNHHRFLNGPQDISSTWTIDGKSMHPLVYMFLWPAQIIKTKSELIRSSVLQNIRWQKRWLAVLLMLMLLLSWKIFLLYWVMVYFGWTLTAAWNYYQHPPIPTFETSSVYAKWYNLLLFNNGLHREHHQNPDQSWSQLKRESLCEN